MGDLRVRILELTLDDWVSDYEMLGEFDAGPGRPGTAYSSMVCQAVDWIRRGVLLPGLMAEHGFARWPGLPPEQAHRFSVLAQQRSLVTQPGQICWFDAGPDVHAELDRLSLTRHFA